MWGGRARRRAYLTMFMFHRAPRASSAVLLRAVPTLSRGVVPRLAAAAVVPTLSTSLASASFSAAAVAPASIHQLEATAIDSSKVALSGLRGKPLLIVNVASR